ncbi:helix-turn-helix domain-containing protein [Methyloglobulus sp.]|uniref:helix-turn-helix domain-containing protein n=1 Tax=Methyloglobulus sp. TaxID=2518622 RepID=UPI0039892BBE
MSYRDLYTTKQAAEKLDVSENTLTVWRCTKRYNLPYIKVGRNVRYTREALDAFLESRTVTQD